MNKKICFIGHRKIMNDEVRNRLYNEVKNQILKGYNCFIVGCHGEFDDMALSVCRKLRREYDNIRIEVVLTSFRHLKTENSSDDYWQLNNKYADVETIIFDIEEVYFKRQIIVSNQKMIDECDLLICYVDKTQKSSGAKLALNYALRQGKQIINLYQNEDNPTFNMSQKEKDEYFEKLTRLLLDK